MSKLKSKQIILVPVLRAYMKRQEIQLPEKPERPKRKDFQKGRRGKRQFDQAKDNFKNLLDAYRLDIYRIFYEKVMGKRADGIALSTLLATVIPAVVEFFTQLKKRKDADDPGLTQQQKDTIQDLEDIEKDAKRQYAKSQVNNFFQEYGLAIAGGLAILLIIQSKD